MNQNDGKEKEESVVASVCRFALEVKVLRGETHCFESRKEDGEAEGRRWENKFSDSFALSSSEV